MQGWIQVTLLLCAFGTLREIRPSEPFVSEFLAGPWRNVTDEQLNQDVYPVGTYAYLAQLLVIFLVTDFLRFKPIIILSGLSGIAVYAILLWTTSIEWLQASQFFYGMYMATEVAYLTYIYAKVESDKYPKVSSFTRMAALAGRFLSGVSSQLLVMYDVMDYRDLNYITFAAQILATFWAIWLPPVQYSIYFHRKSSILTNNIQLSPKSTDNLDPVDKQSFRQNLKEASTLIARHSRLAYTRPKVIAWSWLYAAALALFVQTQIYMQLLWREVQADDQVAFNGFVEAIQTLLGAGGAYIASLYGPSFVPAVLAALQGGALFLGTFIGNVYVSYAGYIAVGAIFHYSITLASAKIASQLSDESCFGLIFGINTLLGTALQSLLTFILISQLQLTIVGQYYALSALYVVLAVTWGVGWMIQVCKEKKSADFISK